MTPPRDATASGIVRPTSDAIEEAVARLKRGELVGLPTETVYGLAADATDPRAVGRIFRVKGRPATNPLIVHVADVAGLRHVVAWPPSGPIRGQLDALADLWPGPLTVVCPRGPGIPDAVTAGRDTVAARIPDHPVASALLRRCPFPLAAPSANRSNYLSPTRAEHVAEDLGDAVGLILDGGPCLRGVESTIVSLASRPARLLRPGSITIETLRERLGDVEEPLTVAERPADGDGESTPAGGESPGMESPGMSRKHYAPKTRLILRGPNDRESVPPPGRYGRLAFRAIAADEASAYAAVEVLSDRGDLEQAARELFAALHRLDRLGLDAIIADRCPETGIGRALMDRLRRAAS